MVTKTAAQRRHAEFSKFLNNTLGQARSSRRFKNAAVIFSQGDAADTVMYVAKGNVKLAVVSQSGKEAVVGVIGMGHFLGEGCLAGQPRRMTTATAVGATTVMIIVKDQMARSLREHQDFAERFLAHMLERNTRIESDLVDQLFNSSEKRLARTLLLLAQYADGDSRLRVVPKLSQETLAEMIGTTRSRVNFFMNKFRRLGYIKYNGRITIYDSLLGVLLHD